jgi:hypothetical protein
VIDVEATAVGRLDLVTAMAMPGSWPEAGDAATGDIFHLRVLALQDQRNLRVEGAGGTAAALAAAYCRFAGSGGRRRCRRWRGLTLRRSQLAFERGDPLFVGLLHFGNLGPIAARSDSAARGERQKDAGDQGRQDGLTHGKLLKNANECDRAPRHGR